MKRILHKSLLLGVICAFQLSFTVQAATISYDLDNKPTEFLGVDVGGTSYDVIVNWGQFFETVYPTTDPLFWGDELGADAAASALLTGLVADSYVGTASTNDILVPYRLTTFVWSRSVRLDTGEVRLVTAGLGNNSPNLGYTTWEISAAVPIPAAAWLFGSALGLLGWVRRRKAR